MAFLGGLFGGVAPFPQSYQTPQNIKDFMQPIPVSEMLTAPLYQNLLGAKQVYDTANKNIADWNEKLALPNLTDEQKQGINENIQNWTRERDKAAQSANSLRNTAATLGIDGSDYGSDKTLQESNQAFQNHKQMAFKNFLNLPTQKELEDDLYAQMRLRGASPRTAEAIVSEERDAIKQQRARRLNDFMGTYGKNPDGSIDQDVGIAAIGSVLQDPQQVAQLFVSGFAMPQKVYDTNQNYALHMDSTNANNAEAMARLVAQTNANLLNAREGRTAQRSNLEYTVTNQNEQNRLQREHQLEIAGINAAIKASGGGKGSGNTLHDEIDAVAWEMGDSDDLPDEERQKIRGKAALIVLDKKYGIGNKTLRDVGNLQEALEVLKVPKDVQEQIIKKSLGWESTKEDEAYKAAGKKLRSMFDDIQEMALAGNKEKALTQLGAVNELLQSDEYRELLDKDARDLAKLKEKMYTKLVNGEYESNEGKTNYIKDRYFIEYGVKPTGDEIQRIMKDEQFFGVPIRPKVKTPALNFNFAPPATSNYNSGQAYNFNPNSVYIPNGQGAYFPNR